MQCTIIDKPGVAAVILFLLAYGGGVLTVLSPCILPVLPFVFARADRPFSTSGLPMLAGMALTFAGVATLAAVGGGWTVAANQYGRLAATGLLGLFGLTLLFPAMADRLTRPLVALGARMSNSADRRSAAGASAVAPSLLLGVATGLLWAPCAGPLLGLILTGAALQGASVHTSLLLACYGAGAATSLAGALLVGGRVFALMKRSLGVGQWIRRGLGAAVLAAVLAIAFGVDAGFLSRASFAGTTSLEQGLLNRFAPAGTTRPGGSPAMMAQAGAGQAGVAQTAAPALELPVEGTLPSLAGAVDWINSPPLTAEGLRGKVVLVDFWTYSCINCLRAIPYVRAWAEKYKKEGLVVIGVHAPEFAFERDIGNVRKAVTRLGLGYPIAIDNNYAIWRSFNNQFWPAHYFIDANGRIRHHHFGEGDYDGSERVIQQLLSEAGRAGIVTGAVTPTPGGVQAAADVRDVLSPETYIGYARSQNFASAGGAVPDQPRAYQTAAVRLNQWGLLGNWTVGAEHAVLDRKDGGIVYRFHARDLHLVLGPDAHGNPVHFQLTLDGRPPGNSHGTDVDAGGRGVVTEQRLYQLVRQSGPVASHTLQIRFQDPGVAAYAFTFG